MSNVDQKTAEEFCALLTDNRDLLTDILQALIELNKNQVDYLYLLLGTKDAEITPDQTGKIIDRIKQNFKIIDTHYQAVGKYTDILNKITVNHLN